MRIPELNESVRLDRGQVTRPRVNCGDPVIRVVNRNHERVSANSARRWRSVRIARRHKCRRSIQWKCIVEEIRREIVKIIVRLPRMSVTSGLRSKSAIWKIWQSVAYSRGKLTDVIPIRAKLRDGVDRIFALSLGAIAVPEGNQVLLARIVVHTEAHG